MRRLLLLLAALLPVMTQAQTDKTLQRIKERRVINIAYRTDAAPFSYEEGGQPTGYRVLTLALRRSHIDAEYRAQVATGGVTVQTVISAHCRSPVAPKRSVLIRSGLFPAARPAALSTNDVGPQT